MKKVLAILLAMVMVISGSVMAYAKGGFVSSPSGNEAPAIIEVIVDEDGCTAEIIITPYSERDELAKEAKEAMIAAYNEIAANPNLTNLCSALKAVADFLGILYENLAVSDLFDITVNRTHVPYPHEYCGKVTIVLKSETFNSFVALLHRNSDGTWEVVQDVIADAENNTITFSSGDFSPYAVVVDTSADSFPDTGENIFILAAVMFVSAASLAIVLVSLKKKRQEV